MEPIGVARGAIAILNIDKSQLCTVYDLTLCNREIKAIKVLSKLPGLKDLNLQFNHITALAQLKDCSSLVSINCNHNRLTDLVGVGQKTHRQAPTEDDEKGGVILPEISSSRNTPSPFANPTPARPVQSAPTGTAGLRRPSRTPSLDGSSSFPSSMPSTPRSGHSLRVLRVSHNKLTDLKELRECTQLTELWVNHNNISDIHQLLHLKGLVITLITLTTLAL